MTSEAILAAAAHYAYELQTRHVFVHSGNRGVFRPVPTIIRDTGRKVLPIVLAVAELDAAPLASLALVESTYADRPRTGVPRPPWHWGLVGLLRAGALAWGVRSGRFSVDRFIEQVRHAIDVSLPDAPRALVDHDDARRSALRRVLTGWPSFGRAIDATEDWTERAADRAARAWATACGVDLPYDSELATTSMGIAHADDDTLPTESPMRRRIPSFPRRLHQGEHRLVGDRQLQPADAACLRANLPAAEPMSLQTLMPLQPGVMSAPDEIEWRVARALGDLLEELARGPSDTPVWSVHSGLRQQARTDVATLLATTYFAEARELDIARAQEICTRWIELSTRGLQRWQAILVWVIEHHADEINALLRRSDLAAVDCLLREKLKELTTEAEVPAAFDRGPDALVSVGEVPLTRGRPSRAAIGPHGFAFRWCSAYGVAFPQYPSSQRPARSARRLRGRPQR